MSVRSPALDGPETHLAPPEDPPSPEQPSGSLTSPLRAAGYAAILTALAFIQGAGLTVADTKFDLVLAPGRFLARSLQLWDPNAAFGQVPDQSYGYVWPMGPFFELGHLAHMPPWMIQRLWWALLLCLAFFGMLRLCERLMLGSDLTRLLAALVFVLTPRLTTLVGVVSVEVWPMALAPWVLIPLVRGSKQGSVRRAAAASALVVGCCGGVNAVAVAAVLPLGVIWLLTREPGPRRWRLLGWWTLFTVLATAWWSGPLLLLGRYAPPFLDYIENATITTLPTDLTRSLLGVSDWVAYFGGPDFGAGLHIVGTPYLLVDAALVAALGLIGMCLPGNPHRRFLVWGLLTGVMLVGFGYARDLPGLFASDRLHSLDLALAPFRNVHKFDVVLRIPLVLGLAHALTELPRLIRSLGSVVALRIYRVAVGVAIFALLTPWLYGVIPAGDGVQQVPSYWRAAATYLADHDDGSVALELPAAPFGVYTWGNVHDDVLQGLATSPWAVRNVVPLAQPGNVVFLDAVTRAVESGLPQPRLAPYLAANGVGTLVVRNDLDRVLTGAPDPAYVKAVLTATPGLTLVKSFGPPVGAAPYGYVDNPPENTRIVQSNGISEVTQSIDVYQVRDPSPAAVTSLGEVLLGDPASPLDAGMGGVAPTPPLLAADATGAAGDVSGQVLTDGLERREMNFPAVRWNESSTMTADAPFRLSGKEQSHRLVDDDARWDTTETWTGGVSDVEASSSQAYADATPPLTIGAHPGAVFDNDPATAWASARGSDPKQQWWQADLSKPRTISRVSVTVAPDSLPLTSLRISGGGQSRTVPAPRPGHDGSYAVGLPSTSSLRISPVYDGALLTGSVGLSEVHIDNLHPQRYLQLPAPLDNAPVDVISLSRDPDRFPCVEVQTAFTCDPVLREPGEDGDTLARQLTVPHTTAYDVHGDGLAPAYRPGLAHPSRTLGGAGHGAQPDRRRPGPGARRDGRRRPGDHLGRQHLASSDPADAAAPDHAVAAPARPQPVGACVVAEAAGAARGRPAPGGRRGREGARHAAPLAGPPPLHDRGVHLPGVHPRRHPLRRARAGHLRAEDQRQATDQQRLQHADRAVRPGTEARRRRHRVRHLPLGERAQPAARHLGPAPAVHPERQPAAGRARRRDPGRGAADDGVPRRLADPDPPGREARLQPSRDRDPRRVRACPPRSRCRPGAPPRCSRCRRTSTRAGRRPSTARCCRPSGCTAGSRGGWSRPVPQPPSTSGSRPAHLFTGLLILGALLAGVCLVAASPLRLRRRPPRDLPALRAAPVGLVDVVLVVVAAAFLTGWAGLAILAVTGLVTRRFRVVSGWAYVAGLALLVATAGLTWGPLKDQSWSLYWAQGWAMVAVAAVSGALLAPVLLPGLAPGTRGRPGSRAARAASSSGRS